MFKSKNSYDYGIKAGYQVRRALDHDEGQYYKVYQPYIYELAAFIAERGEFKYIVDIGVGNIEKLKQLSANKLVLAINKPSNSEYIRDNLPEAKILEFNLQKGVPNISEEILKDAVVISSGVIENIVEPHNFLTALSKISKISPYVLVSTTDRTRIRGPEDFGPPINTTHIREWTIDEFYLLLKNYDINSKVGHMVSDEESEFKGSILSISGTQALPHELEKQVTVQAIMSAYNEEDIIAQSITHLISEGVDVHVMENWSTDSTMDIITELANKHKGITYERFPATKPEKSAYEWRKILARVEEIAANSKYDWILHYDADELRVSPWRDVNLREALSFVDLCGYTSIDFTVADFRPTKDGYDGTTHPDTFFHNFELGRQSGNFVQVKGWKNIAKVDLVSTGGHMAEFKGRKVFPLKFINRHYPLRSVAHAKRKIFKDRKGRYIAAERKLDMHSHYDNYNEEDSYIWDSTYLYKYAPEYFYTEYIVELISGIGVKRL